MSSQKIQSLLNPRFKFPLHILQLILVITAIGLSAPRLFMKNQPRTRANTIALGMGAKSLIILQYQLLTEHVRRLHRYASPKANTILNGLEIVFWAAVVFLVIQANISICVGVGCILSWIVVGIAIVLTCLDAWVFGISWVEYRESRQGRERGGVRKGEVAISLSPANSLGQGRSGNMVEKIRTVERK